MTDTEETTLEPAVTTNEGTPAPEVDTSSEQVATEKGTEATTEAAPVEAAPTWDGFELTAPEGHDKDSVAMFGTALQEQGMAPDAAQKALDKIVPFLQERQLEGINALHETEIAACKADPLIGGDKFDENMAMIAKVAEKYGDEELQTLLKSVDKGGRGLGNNPAINRMMFKVAQATTIDNKPVVGKAPPAGEEDEGAILYPKMTQQMKEGMK